MYHKPTPVCKICGVKIPTGGRKRQILLCDTHLKERNDIKQQMAERFTTGAMQEYAREYRREYLSSPEVREHLREYMRNYHKHPKWREYRRNYMRNYNKRPEVREHLREYMREYDKLPKRRAWKRRYRKTPKGREIARRANHRQYYKIYGIYAVYFPQQDQFKLGYGGVVGRLGHYRTIDPQAYITAYTKIQGEKAARAAEAKILHETQNYNPNGNPCSEMRTNTTLMREYIKNNFDTILHEEILNLPVSSKIVQEKL